jgi:tetrahydromethanopterin S-methyltransferase subunit E
VRAYPQLVLVWHEIVNDTVAGEPLAVTYCPLTGTVMDIPVDRLRHMMFAYLTFHRAVEDALADLGPGH